MGDAAGPIGPFPVGLPTHLRPVAVIGSGSSGVVWAARDTRAGRDVAVKVLDSAGLDRQLLGARLEVEARALARLRGIDGVVEVLELGVTATGTGWLVSRLVPGGSLRDRGEGCADAPTLVRLASALSRTLAAAHAAGVVHGDVSPANVLFGVDDVPELADFGLSRLGDELPDRPGFTPRFASPERRSGAPPDAPGDVYSLAATLRWCAAEHVEVPAPVAAALSLALSEQPGLRPDAATLARRLAGRGSPRGR